MFRQFGLQRVLTLSARCAFSVMTRCWDGTHIIINTARGRVKDKVLRKHPAVAMTITADDPYRYLLIWGHIIEETEVSGYETICSLNEKYRGRYEFPKRPGQVRVTYRILPEWIFSDS